MSDIKPIQVLFVCMGNICRSPTAHGVFQTLVDQQGLRQRIRVDSAGTHSYHIGSSPDPRSQATAFRRGIDLSGLRARRFESADFFEFDYLLAMDNNNLADMLAIKPDDAGARAELMLVYSERFKQREIPDPYFGDDGFDLVFDMIDDAARGLLQQIRRQHGL
ncbi:MAG: low molecular weight phosphotyrosine protein phosphatase [Gammaproteobacteria bacterium]|nr:MAG: low molecular weight phosphotyrosine protein phosphatase [Gammaproteobacteria bacterium]